MKEKYTFELTPKELNIVRDAMSNQLMRVFDNLISFEDGVEMENQRIRKLRQLHSEEIERTKTAYNEIQGPWACGDSFLDRYNDILVNGRPKGNGVPF